jgi:sec-independent protein translocase protein TatC
VRLQDRHKSGLIFPEEQHTERDASSLMDVGTDSTEEKKDELRGQMSFLDHLEELRIRIINMLVALGISFVICFAFIGKVTIGPWVTGGIYDFIVYPIQMVVPKLYYMNVTEPFNLELKVAFVVSLFCAAPIVLSEVWRFISPGLYRHEKRYALPFIISSSLLFMTGMAFAYYVAFPFAMQFLVSVGGELGMTPVLNVSDYFDLFMMIVLALGVVFEIPALIFILSRIGLVSGPFLLRNTKYAILIATIVAAVITPTTDIANMMIVAVPMVGLYLLGVGVAFLFGKKRKSDDATA